MQCYIEWCGLGGLSCGIMVRGVKGIVWGGCCALWCCSGAGLALSSSVSSVLCCV